MFKKIVIFILFSFLLVSCGEDSTVSSNGLVEMTTNNITISIPSNWNVIKDKDNLLPKIKSGEIELAVMSEKMVNGFSNNLLILGDILNEDTTSKEFSMLNNIGAQTDYLDYTNIGSKEIKFLDGDTSILYTFEAKYNLDTPKLKFLQTAHVCDKNKAYFMTLAIPTTIMDTSKYEYLLSTFSCK